MEFSPPQIHKLNHGLKNGNLTMVSMERKRKQTSVLCSVQSSKKSTIRRASGYRLPIKKKLKKKRVGVHQSNSK